MNDLAFANWTLELARKDGIAMGWFEERRFDWCQIAYRFAKNIINGNTIILCSDLQKKWFCEYVLQTINANKGRPLIPIITLESMLPKCQDIDLPLIEDMLSVAFDDRYTIWYIGYANNRLVKLATDHQSSFIWAFDGSLHTAFNMNSSDSGSDVKLLQLFKILDRTIDAVMFNEISDDYGS
ncbi:hypothetical protein CCY99_06295 [Helicobacter sp. 16-1353]|uniref:HobA family DNA replication regulator n=1 Tax=Helicobacter sp. 16-1353 TaxID=2004996 RepID=UPI000DCF4902|nr:HobA family DNA replication regulator [Helicobacter sp. 16-1353]RAX53198.1 hypothetical protein CCY99_06295 [Helicobacter sp. 16-1353]